MTPLPRIFMHLHASTQPRTRASRPLTTLPFFAPANQGKADSAIRPAPSLPIGETSVFLRELRARLGALAASLRLRRAHADQLEVEVSLDIVSDAATQQARAGAHAYSAEQASLEADRLFRAAQLPDTPGGTAITPAEATAAFRHLRHTHRHTHAVSQLLA
jgi:hypothetical protein